LLVLLKAFGSVLHLPVSLQTGSSGTETMSDNEGEGAAGGSEQKLAKLLHMPGEKSATKRHKNRDKTFT